MLTTDISSPLRSDQATPDALIDAPPDPYTPAAAPARERDHVCFRSYPQLNACTGPDCTHIAWPGLTCAHSVSLAGDWDSLPPTRYDLLVPHPVEGSPDRILPQELTGLPTDRYDRAGISRAEDALRDSWQRYGTSARAAGAGCADAGGQMLMAEQLIEIWRRWWIDPTRHWEQQDYFARIVLSGHLVTDPHGALILHGEQRYPPPQQQPQAGEVITTWLAERTEPGGRTRGRVLHEDYQAFCQARGWTPLNEIQFGVRLTGLGWPSRRSGGMIRDLTLRDA